MVLTIIGEQKGFLSSRLGRAFGLTPADLQFSELKIRSHFEFPKSDASHMAEYILLGRAA